MQTFSYLQRSRYDEKNFLNYLFIFLLLFVYEPLTTIYLFLPPLFGLILWQIFSKSDFEAKFFELLYVYIYEVDHSMERFSLFITLFLSIYLLHRLRFVISSQTLLQTLGVLIFYGIFIVVTELYGFIVKENISFDILLILMYVVIDIFIVVVYEK